MSTQDEPTARPPARKPPARKMIASPDDAPNEGVRMLRELRLRLTYGAIARKVGCDERAVRMWTAGTHFPRADLASRLRDAFGIPLEAWARPGHDVVAVDAAAAAVVAAHPEIEDEIELADLPEPSRAGAVALAAAIESMTTGHARVLATALRRMLAAKR